MAYGVVMARGYRPDGSLIRLTRIKRGLSLSQAAEQIGMDKSNLAKIERNEIGISDRVVHRVSTVLELDVEDIAPELAVPVRAS